MKKLTALLLVLCLLLCGCGKSADVAEAPTETPTEAPTETPTEASTEAPTEEPTEPPVLYRHPMTGEPLDEVFTTRPVVSTVNNVPKALPQHSISSADILYEIETEGNATRGLAFFTDLSQVGPLGSIRSARTYLSSIAASYDAVLVHVGASDYARNGQYDVYGNRFSGWQHIDLGIKAQYSYRDQARLDAGYAWEHTLFSSGELLATAMEEMGYETSKEEGYDFGLTFSEEPEFNGDSASAITVTFQGGKTTTMTLNEATGLYEASQYGEPWIDGGNDTVLSFRNVLVLKADRSRPYGKNSFYEFFTTGEGYFACDGKITKILWSRESVDAPFSYTYEDGTPITLGVGKSYVAVLTTSCGDPAYD